MAKPESLRDILRNGYADELYRRWQRTQRMSERQLLETFPEMAEHLPAEVAQQEKSLRTLEQELRHELEKLEREGLEEFERWLRAETLQCQYQEKISAACKNLGRLRRMLLLSQGKGLQNWITDEEVHAARQVPIQNLLDGKFKKSGSRVFALCPLHPDKHPSLCIYTESNTCWCFGCQQGGDSIKLAMLFHGMDFKQAVRSLLEGNV
jgi:DNA primase